ncbi:MAG: hypothetical protein ACE5I9_08955 [Candidatus Methylomirabilales bacterium]
MREVRSHGRVARFSMAVSLLVASRPVFQAGDTVAGITVEPFYQPVALQRRLRHGRPPAAALHGHLGLVTCASVTMAWRLLCLPGPMLVPVRLICGEREGKGQQYAPREEKDGKGQGA